MHLIVKIDNYLEKFEKCLIIFLFSLLLFFITFNILSRNIINYSFEEIFETAPAAVLWLSLAGSSLALKSRRHIKLEILLKFCPEKYHCYINFLVSLFGMAVMGILFCSSLKFVENEIHLFGNKGLLSIIFPFFFAVSFFRYFTWIIYSIPQKGRVL
jgi:TRAP-type C4-dicarboxylate transport system permease small subunit